MAGRDYEDTQYHRALRDTSVRIMVDHRPRASGHSSIISIWLGSDEVPVAIGNIDLSHHNPSRFYRERLAFDAPDGQRRFELWKRKHSRAVHLCSPFEERILHMYGGSPRTLPEISGIGPGGEYQVRLQDVEPDSNAMVTDPLGMGSPIVISSQGNVNAVAVTPYGGVVFHGFSEGFGGVLRWYIGWIPRNTPALFVAVLVALCELFRYETPRNPLDHVVR